MDREKVSSSNIKSAGHDDKTDTMDVEFHNGAVYSYPGVKKEMFDRLIASGSVGKFFHKNILSTIKGVRK